MESHEATQTVSNAIALLSDKQNAEAQRHPDSKGMCQRFINDLNRLKDQISISGLSDLKKLPEYEDVRFALIQALQEITCITSKQSAKIINIRSEETSEINVMINTAVIQYEQTIMILKLIQMFA